MPSGVSRGKTQMLVSVAPTKGVVNTPTNTEPTQTGVKGRYKILTDWDNPVTGIKFYAGEIVEGTPNTKLGGKYIDIERNGKVSSLATTFEVEKVSDDTPLSTASAQQVKASAKKEKGISVAGYVGGLAGLGFAYYKKMGVWGYIGMGILGGIVGSVAYQMIRPKDKK
jgi:hypothetical protein